MRKLFGILAIILFFCFSVNARAKYSDYVHFGGKSVKTSSTTTYSLMETFPSSTVTVYLAGTTTLAAIYTNSTGTVKANPFTATTKAYFEFYVDNGLYDVKFSGTGITTPWTISNIALSDVEDLYNPITFGAKCDNSTNDTTAFSTILTLVGSANATITIPKLGPCRLNTITFPKNVNIEFSSSGGLYVNTGQTVTFQGPQPDGNQQRFYNGLSGQGIFSFSGNRLVGQYRPEWWGGFPDGGSTDIGLNFQAAITSAGNLGGTIKLSVGQYNVNLTTLTIPQYVRLDGVGERASVIEYNGTSYAVEAGSSTAAYKEGIGISNLEILLNSSAGKAIHLLRTKKAVLQNLSLEGNNPGSNTNYGIVIEGGSSGGVGNIYSVLINVDANHFKFAYKLSGTGAGGNNTTSVSFIKCHGNGDSQAGSIGLDVDIDNGDGTSWDGHLESYAIAININGFAVDIHGARFEGNTADIVLSSVSGQNSIINCKNLDHLTNNAGGGFNANYIHGNTKSDGSPFQNETVGPTRLVPFAIANTPLTIDGMVGQTGDLLKIQDSSETAKFLSVTAAGKTKIGNGGALLSQYLSDTVTWNPANLADGASTTTTISVLNAVVGDTVTVGFTSITAAGWQISGQVISSGTVAVIITNRTGGAVDLPSGTLRVGVWQH